jgi:crotonobetainyl-CoA:carnitine CoA-transferase CaiB-like acyl-CoA transferase
MKALEGIRVLDLTHALAGPFCTYHLGLVGADVIKIEKPDGGDDFRDFARQPDWSVSPSFIAVNGGKRSVTVNLKAPEGREIIYRLAKVADVVVENQRPGAVDELKVGWSDLSRINPKLVYCSISGFGQSGEMSRWPAYDHTIQAMSGMSWTGEDGDTPSQGRGFSVDCFSGYVAFSSILAALFRRERTGEGQYLDVAMLDSSFVLMGVGIVRQILTGDEIKATQPIVHDRPTVGAFKTRDGWIWLSANFDHQFKKLCDVLEAPDLAQDKRFATRAARDSHAAALRALLAEKIAPRSAPELEAVLMAVGSPAVQVRTTRQALSLASLTDRDMLLETQTAEGKKATVMNAGFVANVDGPGIGSSGIPALGADTDDVLRELGYASDAITRLRQAGAI